MTLPPERVSSRARCQLGNRPATCPSLSAEIGEQGGAPTPLASDARWFKSEAAVPMILLVEKILVAYLAFALTDWALCQRWL